MEEKKSREDDGGGPNGRILVRVCTLCGGFVFCMCVWKDSGGIGGKTLGVTYLLVIIALLDQMAGASASAVPVSVSVSVPV